MQRITAFCLACAMIGGATGHAAENAPLGGWETTNQCFLAAFFLRENGRAQAAYMTGVLRLLQLGMDRVLRSAAGLYV